MNGIRVSGRKNSGINIDGFNSQGGVHSFCHCYNCCFLIDLSKDKYKLSGVVTNSGTSCSTCRTKTAPACWLTKRRCVECQLFCKCSNCDSDTLLAAKVPIWIINEYRSCYQCGSACMSSQCSDAEFSCNNCFLVLQEVDIDDCEDFGQIFEDGVAAASNTSVSKFTEAVTSIEAASSVQEEEAHSKIVADLQQ